jgi:hypothetical protein
MRTGYALIDLKTKQPISKWDDTTVDASGNPIMRVSIPQKDGTVATFDCPKSGTEIYPGYFFAESVFNDTGSPGKFHSYQDTTEFDGKQYVTTRTYSKTEDICPPSVSMSNARIVLLRAGLLDDITARIEKSKNRELQIAWEYSTQIDRNSPLMKAVADLFQITDEQIDTFFRQAEGLQPDPNPEPTAVK